MLPGGGGEEHKHWEKLKSSRKHIKAEYKLGWVGEGAEGVGRADLAESGTYIIKAGGYRGESGYQVTALNGYYRKHGGDQKCYENDYIRGRSPDRIVVDRLSLQLYRDHGPRVGDVPYLPLAVFKQKHYTGDFNSSCRRACTAAAEHKDKNYNVGNNGPKLEIRRVKARRGDY